MDIRLIKRTILLSGCSIYTNKQSCKVHFYFVFGLRIRINEQIVIYNTYSNTIKKKCIQNTYWIIVKKLINF